MKMTISELSLHIIDAEKKLIEAVTHNAIRAEAERALGITITPKNYEKAYISSSLTITWVR